MSSPTNVLLIFAHPAYEKSRVNAALVDAARTVDSVTVRDLYEIYPGFGIDIAAEQKLLEKHDVIILQHPFYWYSTPAIIKEWFDLVLEYGWAYGTGGNALKGKVMLTVTTTGGGAEAYCAQGHNRFTMREFLRPIEQTARLCGMLYPTPYVVHGSLHMGDAERAEVATRYRTMLQQAAEGALDWHLLDTDEHGIMSAI